MPSFKSLYWDTNILTGGRWPRVSARSQWILNLAANFDIPVIIPQPVQQEHEAQVIRDLEGTWSKLAKSQRDLSERLSDVGAHFIQHEKPDVTKFIEQYRLTATASMQAWGIKEAPITQRSVADLFRLSIAHQPPFRRSGDQTTGFQDAVILYTVIDDMKSSGHSECALLTEDKDFAHASRIAAAEGLTLRQFGSHIELWEVFADDIIPAVSAWWKEDRKAAEGAILKHQAQIESLLLAEVAPSALGSTVRDIKGASVTGVRSVETPLPKPIPDFPGPYHVRSGYVAPISFTASVTFDAVTSGPPLSAFFGLLGGEMPGGNVAALATEAETHEERVNRAVEIECVGTFDGREYQLGEFRVTAVKL